ncbi:peptidoglycan recognition protein family protein [Streptomyces sp. HD]|uniref:peptidoglycan recognition protein family protein n=1 Tax=Streptomyces sp. HD TaxID=3020892 RepID=UPI00232DBD4E|nr:peptidoglycan recognition protein [Streptomyces sp. HD]MDC0773590.1 peptidoglycan recognition protein [Streptomyces sp. HD]
MRGFLASSIGVTCAAVLVLPLTPPAVAATATPARGAEAATSAEAAAGPAVRHETPEPSLPGSTQSLPLAPLTHDRVQGAPTEQGLPRRDVRHFSLVGVVWDDPHTELHGRVQVRTRAVDSGSWSGWQDVETHNAEHAADPGTAEDTSGRLRGSTAPLWVGESNGVEVRVTAEGDDRRSEAHAPAPVRGAADPAPKSDPTAGTEGTSPLPDGLRLELVDPGEPAQTPSDPGGAPRPGSLGAETGETAEVLAASALDAAASANVELAPLGAAEIPALTRAETERELVDLRGGELTQEQRARPHIGPRPRIVTRRGWGANEWVRERRFAYTKRVKAAFVHHTATGAKYWCSQAPSLIRGIYRYHVKSMGWRDLGYNFLVDKCGNIYEGRAGGVAKPVLGAHTLGFNSNSMGIAVIGSYGSSKPTRATLRAIARLTAWKLGLSGVNPRGKTYLRSGGGFGNLHRKGKNVRLNVISGHRDSYSTECPGWQLYRKLGTARSAAARYQGR